MLPKKYRLAGRIETDFFKKAQRINLGWALLYFLPHDLQEKDKEKNHSAIIAIIAGKKQFPKSVQRHQAKRKFFQAIAGIVSELKPGAYVFVLNQRVMSKNDSEISEELNRKLL